MLFNSVFHFFGPRIAFETGGAGKIGEKVRSLGGERVLLCTDKGIVGANLLADITKSLENENLSYWIYDDVEPNPTIETAEKGFAMLEKEQCNIVVAVGGGSSIDAAKAIAVLGTNPPPLSQYFGIGNVPKASLPLVAMPTTAGTGSEVSWSAVITNEAKKLKMGIMGPNIIPTLALLDPSLLRTLPPRAIAEPGMDALVHAIESFTSLFASPFTEGLSLEAIRMIAENLRRFYANPEDMEAASHMLVASTMAGIAFTNGRTGVVHAMAHALGGYYNMRHGLSCAVIMPHAMRFCLMAVPEKFVRIARAMGEKTEGDPVMDAAKGSIGAVERLARDLDLPEHLEALGAKESDIALLAENAMATGIHFSTPRRVTLTDMEALFMAAL